MSGAPHSLDVSRRRGACRVRLLFAVDSGPPRMRGSTRLRCGKRGVNSLLCINAAAHTGDGTAAFCRSLERKPEQPFISHVIEIFLTNLTTVRSNY